MSPQTSGASRSCPMVRVTDALVSILILAPLVVSYWRGTFYLLEMYIFPCEKPLVEPPLLGSLLFSLILGIGGGIVFCYLQHWFRRKICGLWSPVAELFWKRVYCYVFGFILINHWRGVWGLWDIYQGSLTKLQSGLICFWTGTVLLLLLKSFRNVISPPLVTASDLCDSFFEVILRFRIPREKPLLYFLDALFSIAVPGSLIVMVIRGAFYILDEVYALFGLTFREYPMYLTTWTVGLVLCAISFLLQKPSAAVSTKLDSHPFMKLIFEDVYVFFCNAAGVHVWQAVWGLCDVFVFSHDTELSSWICHGVGIGGLMLMFHGSSVLIKGYQIDGEFNNGEGCMLPAESFSIFSVDFGDREEMKRKKARKELQIQSTEEDGVLIKEAQLENTCSSRFAGGCVPAAAEVRS